MELLSNKKILWIIILVLLILNLASMTTIWINVDKDRFPGIRESRVPLPRGYFLKRELNFSVEQQAEFDSLLNKHRDQIESKVNEIRTLREKLMSMMKNQKFTPESEEIVRSIGERQSELEMLNYNHFREVMAICDDEQKQIFLETLKRAVGPHYREGMPNDIGPERRGIHRNWKR